MNDRARRFRFDEASAISQGARDYQEDALISDFPSGGNCGLAVLADGMGGHAAGDVAAKIVVTHMFSELVFHRRTLETDSAAICSILTNAAQSANASIRDHVAKHPNRRGMGATLVSALLLDDALHWISIGDSPLFLFRDGSLSQLNEDHSLAPLIDRMVETGALTQEQGRDHPDRNSLTSVLVGQGIPQIDCPKTPTRLIDGDIVILASDGLQFLSNDEIAATLQERPLGRSADLAEALMRRVEVLRDPDQDNVSLSVIRVLKRRRDPLQPVHSVAPRRISAACLSSESRRSLHRLARGLNGTAAAQLGSSHD